MQNRHAFHACPTSTALVVVRVPRGRGVTYRCIGGGRRSSVDWLAVAQCQDGVVRDALPVHPDLQPANERAALQQRLDQYRAVALTALVDVPWEKPSTRLLPSTDMAIAGIVKHLAWAEDRWFQGRLVGAEMPPPWDQPGADDPHRSMRLVASDTVDSIAELYMAACERSRAYRRRVHVARPACRCAVLRSGASEPSLDPRAHDRRDRSPRRSPRPPGRHVGEHHLTSTPINGSRPEDDATYRRVSSGLESAQRVSDWRRHEASRIWQPAVREQ